MTTRLDAEGDRRWAKSRGQDSGFSQSICSALPDFVIVTGMSGAGRTEAMHVFEDLGYYCVDNLPSSLPAEFVEREREQLSTRAVGVAWPWSATRATAISSAI